MICLIDKYIGKVIGQYLVVARTDKKNKYGHKLYDAMCIKCGFLRRGARIVDLKEPNLSCRHTHNVKWQNARLHSIFNGIVDRCYNRKNKAYRFYGGKGIKIFAGWLHDRGSFETWALSSGYADDLTIDRKDPDLDYCPSNCHWVPFEDNCKWKSTTARITVGDITDSGRGWASRLGYGVNYINTLIRKKGMEFALKFIISKLAVT